MLALATAAELPRVPLAEALAICLLLLDEESQRFELAALRWHARLCRDARLSLAEATIALGGLSALGGGRVDAGAHALLAVLDARHLGEVSRSLDEWLDARARTSS
jgi:hypothetical protein